jgi:hypothetical protein
MDRVGTLVVVGARFDRRGRGENLFALLVVDHRDHEVECVSGSHDIRRMVALVFPVSALDIRGARSLLVVDVDRSRRNDVVVSVDDIVEHYCLGAPPEPA